MKVAIAKLNVKSGGGILHARPSAFIVSICCRWFPQTEFRIARGLTREDIARLDQNGGLARANRFLESTDGDEAVDPKSILLLMSGLFHDGEEVSIQAMGRCETMAVEFFRVIWENFEEFGSDFPGNKAEKAEREKAEQMRLTALIDEAFSRIQEPDLEGFEMSLPLVDSAAAVATEEECRSVATINDRLHNLTLLMLPKLSKHFQCQLQVAFELPSDGVFSFVFRPDSDVGADLRILNRILELPVGVGTRITVLTQGSHRFEVNKAVKNILQNLWQCDGWLRARGRDIDSSEIIRDLVEFAERTASGQSLEYGVVQNPYISNLLTPQHVFINPASSDLSKEDVIGQLAAPHATLNGLELNFVTSRVNEVEKREAIVLRDGFAIAHGVMERNPRIAISFGTYPNGVAWDEDGKIVRLVAMVVFARDTYGTWRDYLRKIAIVFRTNPDLQERLIRAKSCEDFRNTLRETEGTMM